MIQIKCTSCKKDRWTRKDVPNYLCKPCRRKKGIKDPSRRPRFKRSGPKLRSAPQPKKEKKEKKR